MDSQNAFLFKNNLDYNCIDYVIVQMSWNLMKEIKGMFKQILIFGISSLYSNVDKSFTLFRSMDYYTWCVYFCQV